MSSRLSAPEVGLDPSRLPRHVAMIMDGNGRWAKSRLLNRIKGHEKGADTVRAMVRACRELAIPYLTLYAFSTENWLRPKSEVEALMHLLRRFLQSEKAELVANDIRLSAIGELQRLPNPVQVRLQEVMAATQANQGLTRTLALSYGSRNEILSMVREVVQKVQSGSLAPGEISEETVAHHLFTRGLPDPDLLIRTGGEMRISNFLLYQIAYAEIYVTPTFWPDFDKAEFLTILQAYQERERRFGKV
ncbi:MAG: isoprenyl transferase [Desulfobacterales bacterium]